MGVNITDVDVFTDPIVAPADGDPGNGATFQSAPQGLGNRTRNLKNRLDAVDVAIASIATKLTDVVFDGYLTPGTFADGATLDVAGSGGDGWDLTTNEVTVPSAGMYLIVVLGDVLASSDAVTDPRPMTIDIMRDTTVIGKARGWRWSDSASDPASIFGYALLAITTPAAQKISFENASGTNLQVPTGTAQSQEYPIAIIRLGDT